MARKESRTHTGIWSDEEFRNLTALAQRRYWQLYSQPTILLCGVLDVTKRRWAGSAADDSLEQVEADLTLLLERSYILIDEETEELLVRTFARWDKVHMNAKTWVGAWNQLAHVASPLLRKAAEDELNKLEPPASMRRPPDDPPPRGGAGHPTDSPQSGEKPTGEGLSGGQGNAHRRPIDARSPHPQVPSPSPSTSPIPTDRTPRPASPTGMGHGAPHRDDNRLALAKLIAAACVGDNRSLINLEAMNVAGWATAEVDTRVIEEAIGSAREAPEKPVLPRAIAKRIQQRAADRGIRLADFKPLRSAS